MKRIKKAWSVLAVLSTLAGTVAQAGEFYGQAGLPGVMLGYSQPLNPSFGLRADVSTLGRHKKRVDEEGIRYDARGRFDRIGLFADWFPMQGGFRLTGGLTFNDGKISLGARGNGGTITVGDTTYTTTSDDRFDVRIKYPRVTPYVGIGYGHQLSPSGSWRFLFDLGATFGKAKVSGRASGPWADQVAESDIDAELDELRDGVGEIRAIPQLSFGVSYSF